MEANHRRSWLGGIFALDVRSTRKSASHSLIRFSISARAQQMFSCKSPGVAFPVFQSVDQKAQIGLSLSTPSWRSPGACGASFCLSST